MKQLILIFFVAVNCFALPQRRPGLYGGDCIIVQQIPAAEISKNESQNETTIFSGAVPAINSETTIGAGLLGESSTATAPPPKAENLLSSYLIPTSAAPLLAPEFFDPILNDEDGNDNTSVVFDVTTLPPPTISSPSSTPAVSEKVKEVTVAAASSTSSTFYIPITRSNDPSVSLVAPSLPSSQSSTISPSNLQDLPISLVSLAGNSGGFSGESTTTGAPIFLSSPPLPPLGEGEGSEGGEKGEGGESSTIDFTKFRYHVETGELVKIGSTGKGICPSNMRFFAVPGHPKNGACDCDYYQCSRPLIYSPEQHQCYWAWSQGPCVKEEWFVFDNDLKKRGKCVKNPCPPETPPNNNIKTLEYFFQNPEDDTCYEAGTQGYCLDSDERLLMYPGEPIPTCRKFTLCFPLTVPQELQCIYGNKYYVESGHC